MRRIHTQIRIVIRIVRTVGEIITLSMSLPLHHLPP